MKRKKAMCNINAKIYIAGHRGLVGGAHHRLLVGA